MRLDVHRRRRHRAFVIFSCLCVRIVTFSLRLFCMDSNFYINHHFASNFDLPFLPICNSYTVEFYYQMFVLYRHAVLFFFRLSVCWQLLLHFILPYMKCVDTLIMALIPLTLFMYTYECMYLLELRKSTISICLEYKRHYYNLL